MLDPVMKNGMVVEGTGAPGHRVAVAIQEGKIAAMGKVTECVYGEVD